MLKLVGINLATEEAALEALMRFICDFLSEVPLMANAHMTVWTLCSVRTLVKSSKSS